MSQVERIWPVMVVLVGLAGCPGSVPDEAVFGESDIKVANTDAGSVSDVTADAPGDVPAEVSGDAAADSVSLPETALDSSSDIAVVPPVVPKQLNSGGHQTCTVLSDGSSLCWGHNSAGQLGNGKGGKSTSASHLPVTVDGPGSFTTGSCGDKHCCAIDGSGKVWCWGDNSQGQIESDTGLKKHLKPVLSALMDKAILVAAGGLHSCAVVAGGKVRCWGLGNSGQLGQGEEKSSKVPVDVVWLKDVVQLDAGFYTACARTQTGELWCWGYNGDGQVGTETWQKFISTPIKITGVAPLVAFACGLKHTCAAEKGGKVWCWGRNDSHQLGKGSGNINYSKPQMAVGLKDVLSLAAGDAHTCAVHGGGKVWCWGRATNGESGQPKGPMMLDFPTLVGGIEGVATVTAGKNHTCVMTHDNALYCWGAGGHGQVGAGSKADQFGPAKVM